MVFRKTVFPLRAEYQPTEDDFDGPSIDECVVVDTDEDDDAAAAPVAAARMDSDSDSDNATPAPAMDDTIASASATTALCDQCCHRPPSCLSPSVVHFKQHSKLTLFQRIRRPLT
eukprot:6213320-Pleurochrysis_carterae.AAC.4